MSEFPKPDVASGGIRLDGDRMQALVVGLASGRRDKTTQGTCSTSARVRTPCAMTADPGPELDHRVPWGQDCRPVRLHAHGSGRLAAIPRWTCAPGSKGEVRLCEDLSGAQGLPITPLECDGLGMTSHAWCTGYVAGFANLHSNGRVLPFGVGTVGHSIGSANLCGLDLFHVRSGQSWRPSYKMDLGLLPFCERPNAH